MRSEKASDKAPRGPDTVDFADLCSDGSKIRPGLLVRLWRFVWRPLLSLLLRLAMRTGVTTAQSMVSNMIPPPRRLIGLMSRPPFLARNPRAPPWAALPLPARSQLLMRTYFAEYGLLHANDDTVAPLFRDKLTPKEGEFIKARGMWVVTDYSSQEAALTASIEQRTIYNMIGESRKVAISMRALSPNLMPNNEKARPFKH